MFLKVQKEKLNKDLEQIKLIIFDVQKRIDEEIIQYLLNKKIFLFFGPKVNRKEAESFLNKFKEGKFLKLKNDLIKVTSMLVSLDYSDGEYVFINHEKVVWINSFLSLWRQDKEYVTNLYKEVLK